MQLADCEGDLRYDAPGERRRVRGAAVCRRGAAVGRCLSEQLSVDVAAHSSSCRRHSRRRLPSRDERRRLLARPAERRPAVQHRAHRGPRHRVGSLFNCLFRPQGGRRAKSGGCQRCAQVDACCNHKQNLSGKIHHKQRTAAAAPAAAPAPKHNAQPEHTQQCQNIRTA